MAQKRARNTERIGIPANATGVNSEEDAHISGVSHHADDGGRSESLVIAEPLLRGKHVVVLGLARQGAAAARYLYAAGATVTVSDRANEEQLRSAIEGLADLPVRFALSDHPLDLLDHCDLVVLSGGVPPQIPFVQEAIARGIRLNNDGLLTLRLARARDLGPIVAVTGSSGKTTTTTLIGEMLANDRPAVHVGGNIGVPLVDRMDDIRPAEPIVLELSSFQLELFDPALTHSDLAGIGPDIAVVTNITPNHLDRHPSMAAYATAKLNLLRTLPAGAQVVLNLDDAVTAALTSDRAASEAADRLLEWDLVELITDTRDHLVHRNVQVVPYSLRRRVIEGACLVDDVLTVDGNGICGRSELRLRGEHNVSNMLAAAAASSRVGASLDAIRRVATTFQGVPHRLEVVANLDGVTWINDSIATSPERAVAALRSFGENGQTIVLLAGGKDKNLPWDVFAAETVERVSFLIGFGESGPMIVNLVKEHADFSQRPAPGCATVKRLDEAVALAAKVAAPGAVVLLSPGGTSFDAYKDFEERGEHFRQLVWQHRTDATISSNLPTDGLSERQE